MKKNSKSLAISLNVLFGIITFLNILYLYQENILLKNEISVCRNEIDEMKQSQREYAQELTLISTEVKEAKKEKNNKRTDIILEIASSLSEIIAAIISKTSI